MKPGIIMRHLSAVLLLLGIGLIIYASPMEPYTDRSLFEDRYYQLSSGQSDEFFRLRDAMLTPKYRLQDYAGTCIALAGVLFLISWTGKIRINTPGSQEALTGLTFAAPLATFGALVFELFVEFRRGEYPHWADSLGIPLFSYCLLLFLLLCWSIPHTTLLRHDYRYGIPISPAVVHVSNLWLLLMALVSLAVIISSGAYGEYMSAMAGVLWLYVYLSIAAVRRSTTSV